MYFWETRRWLSFFNVKDARETKKMQHRHGIWSAACAEWNLPLQQHYSHSVVNGWNTSMCSSKGLVAWLFGNVGSFQRGRSFYGSRQSSVALHNIYEMAENGYNESDEATRDSSMVLPGGVMVQIGACGMLSTPLWGIKQKWPSVEADWRHLATQYKFTPYRLEPFPDCEILPLSSLITAMYLRELANGSDMPAMRAVRSALLAPIIMFFELDVSRRLSSLSAHLELPVVQSDRGPSLKKRLRMSLVQKRQVVSKTKNDGSTETITAAIQQHNGMATVISAAKIGIYMQKSTAEFMCTGRLKF